MAPSYSIRGKFSLRVQFRCHFGSFKTTRQFCIINQIIFDKLNKKKLFLKFTKFNSHFEDDQNVPLDRIFKDALNNFNLKFFPFLTNFLKCFCLESLECYGSTMRFEINGSNTWALLKLQSPYYRPYNFLRMRQTMNSFKSTTYLLTSVAKNYADTDFPLRCIFRGQSRDTQCKLDMLMNLFIFDVSFLATLNEG